MKNQLLPLVINCKDIITALFFCSPFEVMHFNDTSLLPYTNYDYHIETSNIGGTTQSSHITARTISGIPTGVPPLQVSDIGANVAKFEWSEPYVLHGPIEKYVLQVRMHACEFWTYQLMNFFFHFSTVLQ